MCFAKLESGHLFLATKDSGTCMPLTVSFPNMMPPPPVEFLAFVGLVLFFSPQPRKIHARLECLPSEGLSKRFSVTRCLAGTFQKAG